MVARDEIIMLCKVMEMKTSRDIDDTSITIFKTILSISDTPISSSVVSHLTGVHRLTVRHHLERMKDIGYLKEKKGKYIIKFESLRDYVHFKKKLMIKTYEELEKIAMEIDKEVERKNYLTIIGEEDE
ncbi:hypothetical protein KO465_06570 [Candidatus Micrarchaeota archaeon]|nr:hypothetical protein [Candidatus Micrarchaeota archaeon]